MKKLDTNEGVALRWIDSDAHLSKCVDTAEIIQKNLDLEDKLTQVREEAKRIGISDSLNKDQTELLRLNERCDHIIFYSRPATVSSSRPLTKTAIQALTSSLCYLLLR